VTLGVWSSGRRSVGAPVVKLLGRSTYRTPIARCTLDHSSAMKPIIPSSISARRVHGQFGYRDVAQGRRARRHDQDPQSSDIVQRIIGCTGLTKYFRSSEVKAEGSDQAPRLM